MIAEGQALLSLPRSGGGSGFDLALVIRDKKVVDGLTRWYDEVLWNSGNAATEVDFAKFADSFGRIAAMYGFKGRASPAHRVATAPSVTTP